MAKKFKTNALRMLDKAKIAYSIKEYEYDEDHLDGRHVASQVDMDPNAIFKTLVLHDHHNEHLVCCVPVLEEIDLKKQESNRLVNNSRSSRFSWVKETNMWMGKFTDR